jgi:MFS transporter, Spinster family, sphingosine-1-phosphate transporter
VDVVHPSLRATAVSMAALAQNLFGFAVGPLVVGAISDTYGLRTALAVIPLFCAFAAFFFWLASRHYRDDLRRAAVRTSTDMSAEKDLPDERDRRTFGVTPDHGSDTCD